jgi:hypothetical protein
VPPAASAAGRSRSGCRAFRRLPAVPGPACPRHAFLRERFDSPRGSGVAAMATNDLRDFSFYRIKVRKRFNILLP